MSSDDIPLCEPNISGSEWQYVKECLDSGWVSSSGSFTSRFEESFAAAVGARHAIAVVNGTAAMHLALLLSGVSANDEVIMPSLTFIAPANAIRYANAWPMFLDVDLEYGQLDSNCLDDYLRNECRREGNDLVSRLTKRKVTAVLVVHILGHPSDLDAIAALAEEFGLLLIEDATESLGAQYRGVRIGQTSKVAAFSFNGNKLLTTGGGGMVVTHDPEVAARARYLSTQAKDDPVEFVHRSVGFNYRITSIQAAIGCAQLERLDEFVEVKRNIAARYQKALGPIRGLTPMKEAPWAQASFWLNTVRVDERLFGCSSRALMRALANERISTRPLWQPLHLSPAHRGEYLPCPNAEQWAREALSLPSSTHLSEEQQNRVIAAIQRGAASQSGPKPDQTNCPSSKES